MSHNWMRGRTIVYNPVPKSAPRPKRFRAGRILWEALRRTATLFGFIMLISIVLGAIAASRVTPKKAPVLPHQMVLLLDMSGETQAQNGPALYLKELGLGAKDLSVPDMVDAIDAGAKDGRVQALAMFLDDSRFDVSDLQELRAAIVRFRASGKPVTAYADSFGGNGSGLGLYYLASAANEIWMQPVGVVAVPGMSAQQPFVRGFLEKIGVAPQFFQRKEFKTAMEPLTSREMSPQSREQMVGMVNDLGDQITSVIAKDRKKVGANFRALMDQGLFTDTEALRYGLVDHVKYRDEYIAAVRQSVKGNAKFKKPDFVNLEQYSSVPSPFYVGGPTVARITVKGMIVEGAQGGNPFGEEGVATSADVANAIMRAAEDTAVRGILLRIDSPGGTPTAAETIHRAVMRAKSEFKKPVFVSMGNVAASGGYWIAAPADRIYALPATLTGSIGVVGGKFDASGLWSKLDVNWEEINYARNSGMWSMNRAFTAAEQERFENSLDSVYATFIKRVSEGRKLKPEQVEQVAKGHVWTGRQGKELGLVDELGGEDVALDALAKRLGRNNRMEVAVVDLPEQETRLQMLMKMLATEAALPAILPRGVIDYFAPALVKTDGRLVYQSPLQLH